MQFFFLLLSLLLLLLFFSFNPCNSKTVNGTGLKLCTQVGYHDGSCNGMLIFDNLINVRVINERLPQAIHYNGDILCALLASDNTYDYETLSEGYAHQNI